MMMMIVVNYSHKMGTKTTMVATLITLASHIKRCKPMSPLVSYAMLTRPNKTDSCPWLLTWWLTLLTSPKKGETAVLGCNPTLSVSVVLVSRKVNFFYVVYQPCSFACILVIFLADKVSCRSYVSLQHYHWRSFAYFTFTLSTFFLVEKTKVSLPLSPKCAFCDCNLTLS